MQVQEEQCIPTEDQEPVDLVSADGTCCMLGALPSDSHEAGAIKPRAASASLIG